MNKSDPSTNLSIGGYKHDKVSDGSDKEHERVGQDVDQVSGVELEMFRRAGTVPVQGSIVGEQLLHGGILIQEIDGGVPHRKSHSLKTRQKYFC